MSAHVILINGHRVIDWLGFAEWWPDTPDSSAPNANRTTRHPATTELVLPSSARCALIGIDLIETIEEE